MHTATIMSTCTPSTAYQVTALLPHLKPINHIEVLMMMLNTHHNMYFPAENPPTPFYGT